MKLFHPSGRHAKNTGFALALTALVIALFYIGNLALGGLADYFSWYFYTEERYDLSVGEEADAVMAQVDTPLSKVKILFCDLEENIAVHQQLDYVYETASRLASRYPDKIELAFTNLYLSPETVTPYTAGGEAAVSSSSVIFDYDGTYLVKGAEDFYVLDSNSYVTAYRGEETVLASLLWVTGGNHPVAYFTSNHGEEIPTSLSYALFLSGYRVARLDLSSVSSIPSDCGLLIVYSPLYDFQKSAEGSLYVSELNKMENYLASGGKMLVCLHPDFTAKLPRLLSFLADYGIAVDSGRLLDGSQSLPSSSGLALFTRPADGVSLFGEYGGQFVMPYAAPMHKTASEKASVTSLLTSYASSYVQEGDTVTQKQSDTSLVADVAGGGRLVAVGSSYAFSSFLWDSEYYGNRQMTLCLLGSLSSPYQMNGVPRVPVKTAALDNVSTGEAKSVLLINLLLLPLLVGGAGVFVLVKRKNR